MIQGDLSLLVLVMIWFILWLVVFQLPAVMFLRGLVHILMLSKGLSHRIARGVCFLIRAILIFILMFQLSLGLVFIDGAL